MKVIINRSRLEELEEKARKLDCGMSYSVINTDVFSGRWVSIQTDSVRTYNATESEKKLHEIIKTQRSTIENLNEIIEEKNKKFF